MGPRQGGAVIASCIGCLAVYAPVAVASSGGLRAGEMRKRWDRREAGLSDAEPFQQVSF